MTKLAATLGHHHYINVETFRRNKTGVKTPVWFVVHNGRLCFSAPAHTGKVKRLAHTKTARVAPCDGRGAALGEWSDVYIEPVSSDEANQVNQLLKQKYGLQWRMLDLFGKIRRWKYVMYRIEQAAT